MVFVATVSLTVFLYIVIPKGFFPTQDTGIIIAITDTAQDISYDGIVKLQHQVDEMVLNLDIAPTLLELAGVPIPPAMQGKSMVKLGQKQDHAWRKDWLYEYYEYPEAEQVKPHRGVRTDRYKFIHYFTEPQEYELYDLASDPGELHNLHGDPAFAGLERDLAARLAALRRESNDTMEDMAV